MCALRSATAIKMVVERLSCHLAALVMMRGHSPPWTSAEVEAGAKACAHWPPRVVEDGLTEDPG
jgi:hypothetical protein